MLKNWKLGIVLAAAAVLTACGGGGDPTPRGAIAVDSSNGVAAIVVGYTSQAEANGDAVGECAYSGCVVALEFSGRGTCGSIAFGTNGQFGVASGPSKEDADTRAVQSCRDRGGVSCSIPTSLRTQQCN